MKISAFSFSHTPAGRDAARATASIGVPRDVVSTALYAHVARDGTIRLIGAGRHALLHAERRPICAISAKPAQNSYSR